MFGKFKKDSAILCAIIIAIIYSNSAFAQPQWKFPIAFEDATGAKDTVFFIWDSTATFGVDTLLGEIPMSIDTNVFQVYMYISSSPFDSSKVCATNTNYSIHKSIYATNYVYPITIRWDTSLFFSSVLPKAVDCAEMDNDYFFLYSQSVCHTFDMFTHDSVIAPSFTIGSQSHFPLTIGIMNDGSCCLSSVEESSFIANDYLLWPNPVTNDLYVRCSRGIIKSIKVFSMDGREISFSRNYAYQQDTIIISIDSLSPGVYLMEIINEKNERRYERFIKI